MKTWPSAVFIGLSLVTTVATAKSPAPAAVFNFSFDDTSLEGQQRGTRPDEQQRLAALNDQLKDILQRSGCCQVDSLGPVEHQAQTMDMRTCNGCDVDLAREIGARISVTGWVQKVSNLILNINLVVRDVSTGKVIQAGSVVIRGNTDESWSRGLAYLLRERMHCSDW